MLKKCIFVASEVTPVKRTLQGAMHARFLVLRHCGSVVDETAQGVSAFQWTMLTHLLMRVHLTQFGHEAATVVMIGTFERHS